MVKKFFVTVSIAVMTVANIPPSVYATASLNTQLSEVKKKQNNVDAEKAQLESQLAKTQKSKEEAEQELKRLELSLAETKREISAVQAEMDKLKKEIAKLEEEIAILVERMDRRYEILKGRLVSIQRSGGKVSYLEVLLGSESFGNFVDRLNAVSIIMKSDQEILKDQELDQKELTSKKEVQGQQLERVEDKRKEMDTLYKKLEKESEAQKEIKSQLEQQEEELEHHIMDAKEEQQILANQEATIQKAIEEEKRKQEEALQNNKPSSNGGSGEGNRPPVTAGTFMRPSVGPVTSEFGPRWGKIHYGIDIGKSGNNVPIVSVADGVVSSSYYSSSYGNVVFVNHYVNEQVYTTVYAHLENRAVSEGQRVSKGEFLGYMGNTGISTGAHLHFEFHEGQWTSSKGNAVNPRKYIQF